MRATAGTGAGGRRGLPGWREKVRQFLWGLFYYDSYRETAEQARKLDDLVRLMIFGEFLGLPLMNASISLRLLPYALEGLPGWRERLAQEVDIVEELPHFD
ncbi:MAG: hypothetical protein QJR08_02260 [Bacillota bacterium]|nr:hypothetical protein [Bacillota bacterium]